MRTLSALHLAPRADGSVAHLGNGLDRLIGPALFVSLILLGLGVYLPLFEISRLFIFTDEVSILFAIIGLWNAEEYIIAVVIALFSIVFPLLKIDMAYRVLRRFSVDDHRTEKALKRMEFLSKWSMVDVFVVAAVVFSAKASGVATAMTKPGIYLFAGSVLLSAAAIMRLKSAVGRLKDTSNA